jgi:hypothetical protein
MIFVIYGVDMEEWLKYKNAFTYTDDTSTSVGDKDVEMMLKKLEEDGQNVLKFMASNGLVPNPGKTVFMMLGNKKEEETMVKVGGKEIPQSRTKNC